MAALSLPRIARAEEPHPAPLTLVPSLTPSATPKAASVPEPSYPKDADSPLVPLDVAVEGSVIVDSAAGRTDCFGPCVLRVAPGFVRIRAGGSSAERHVDGPSRLRMTAGVPPLRTAGLVALASGALVVVAAIVIPIAVCGETNKSVDSTGHYRSTDPCRDLSDGLKIGWIAGAGIGLTAATLGAIVYVNSGPSLVVDAAPPPPPPTVAIGPWFTRSAAGSDATAGLTGIVRF